jgi:Bacterial Ig-like domain
MIRSAASQAMWVGRARTFVFFILALLVAASTGVLLAANPAHAVAHRVNSMEDAGDNDWGDGECATDFFQPGTEPNCTLRAAIQETNVNDDSDTIIFDPALSGTITLGQLEITADDAFAVFGHRLDIQGPGARTITVSANDASRVVHINEFADATISGLTISDGSADCSCDFGSTDNIGGGILNEDGALFLANTTVSDNTAKTGGGGINNYNGWMTLTNTTVSGNTAASSGGISNHGTMELTNTTVSGNTATTTNGGGIGNGGTMELTNTTVSGNTATFGAGGIYNPAGATIKLRNTIIARNTASTHPDAEGTFASEGNNLIGNTTGVTGLVPSDLRNVNPLLGPLQNNGGATNTRALLMGSPAVDAANNTACPVTDQRGARRDDGNNDGTRACDIGAFEVEVAPKVTTMAPSAGKIGVARNTNLTATFSEKMARTSITKSTFKLFKCPSTTSTSCTTQITNVTVSLSTDGLKATLNPFGTSSTLLLANTKYKAVVTTGAKDLAGNALDQNSTTTGPQQKEWTFTTGG